MAFVIETQSVFCKFGSEKLNVMLQSDNIVSKRISPFGVAASRSGGQEILSNLWSLNVQYCVHKIQPQREECTPHSNILFLCYPWWHIHF
jgi:hypothetical protein